MNPTVFNEITDFIRSKYSSDDTISLHRPVFGGNEKKYLLDTIDTTYVSSVGKYVDRFEEMMCELTGCSHAVAVVNGTSAVQVTLKLAGVKAGDEVLAQALTFIATINAIVFNGARPVFLDVDMDTMGLSPRAVEAFLEEFGEIRDSSCYNKVTGNRIAACLPMHTFGFPVHLTELAEVCGRWQIPLVEDAAESIGSQYHGKHTGSFGKLGAFSFNGNKIVTSGGGGAIVTNDEMIGKLAKHLTTTAKLPHQYEYIHDAIGYNFRMPNINAALACAQLEQLEGFIKQKRELAKEYSEFFAGKGIHFRTELPGTSANYWLMCLQLEDLSERDFFLQETNKRKIMTRPIWQLIYKSKMYADFYRDSQENAEFLEQRIVNIPSSVQL